MQFEGSGCCIARVGKGVFFVFFALDVDRVKCVVIEIDFAADFAVGHGVTEADGYGFDGFGVGRYIFALRAIAAGDAAREQAVFVD